ncbi:MAG: hypothetical protein U0L16_02025, partial [Phocaeicola sp.]|nr:hypothetical protein [Phocaeicola sp.]
SGLLLRSLVQLISILSGLSGVKYFKGDIASVKGRYITFFCKKNQVSHAVFLLFLPFINENTFLII